MISPEPKRIALVAHDDRKGDLLEWAEYNRDILASHVPADQDRLGLVELFPADDRRVGDLLGEQTEPIGDRRPASGPESLPDAWLLVHS